MRGSDLTFRLVNPAYQAIAPGKAMLGRTIFEVWPETQPLFGERCGQVLNTGVPFHVVDEPVPVVGGGQGPLEPAFFSWSMHRVDLSGDGPSLLITVWETSEKRRAQEALRNHERLLRTVTEHTHVGLAIVSPQHRYVYANRAYGEILGLPPMDLVGLRVADVLAPVYDQQIRPRLERAFAGERMTYELALPPLPGQTADRYFSVTYEPPSTGLAAAGVVVAVADITQRRTLEDRMSESEGRFRDLADNIPQLAWMTDEKGWIFWYNRRWFEYTGTTLEEMQGWGWMKVHHPHFVNEVVAKFTAALESGQPWEDTFPLRGADGLYRWFLSRARPIRDKHGKIVRWFGSNTDITEQRLAEEELAFHRENLEAMVQERTSDLLEAQARLRQSERLAAMGTLAAGLGHDLSNLMLPLRSRLDALEQEPLTPSARQEIAGIAEGMKYLQRLSTGLRQMAADPEAPPPPHGTDLTEWWLQSRGMLKAALPRHIQLVSDLPRQPPTGSESALPPVRVNPAALTQAIFNLVQNAGEALGNQRDGSVTISAAPSQGADGPGVVITVGDNGPGMSEEVAARCFEPYFSTKGRAVSTGLGLSLVRGVVEGAGGTIEVHSKLGSGTVFALWFPAVAKQVGSPGSRRDPMTAAVDIADPRRASLVTTLLRNLGVDVKSSATPNGVPENFPIWVTDERPPSDLVAFLSGDSSRGVVVFADRVQQAAEPEAPGDKCLVYAGRAPLASEVRTSLMQAVECARGGI